MSNKGWEVGDCFAVVEQFFSQCLVKFSASGDDVVQDYFSNRGLKKESTAVSVITTDPGVIPVMWE